MHDAEENVFVIDEILIGGAALYAAARAAKSFRDEHRKALKDALAHLESAIGRHERHLSGKEPTSAASQQAMMREMKEARRALLKGLASEKAPKRDAKKNPESTGDTGRAKRLLDPYK